MAETSAVSGIIIVIGKLINAADEVKNAPTSAENLKKRCTSINSMLERCNGSNFFLVSEAISNIVQQIDEGRKTIEKYTKKMKKYENEPIYKKIATYPKYIYHSWNYNQQFIISLGLLDDLFKQLESELKVSKDLIKPSALAYLDKMEPEVRKFWIHICGNNLHDGKASWGLFFGYYESLYGKLNNEAQIKIRRVASVQNEFLNVFGFMNLTSKYGLPINLDELPKSTELALYIYRNERSELAHALMVKLWRNYDSASMKEAHKIMITYFRGRGRGRNQQWRRQRANQCTTIFYNTITRKLDNKLINNEEIHTIRVITAHMKINSFYMEIMDGFRCGLLTRDDFDRHFLSEKGIMQEVITYSGPLFYAVRKLLLDRDNVIPDYILDDALPDPEEFIKKNVINELS